MKVNKEVNWILVGLLLVALSVAAGSRAYADKNSGDRITQSNDMNNQTAGDIDIGASSNASAVVGDMIGGDTSLSSTTKNLAIAAPNLGDVDIAQCLGSTQWSLLVGGKQKLVLNQVCMAEFYLKTGRYDLAAQALCNQPEIIAEYDTEADCEASHDFTPAVVVEDHDIHKRSDEFELAYAQQEEEIQYMQAEQATLVGRIDMLTDQIEQAPEPVIIYEHTEYTDEQFDAVFMALKGGDEDE